MFIKFPAVPEVVNTSPDTNAAAFTDIHPTHVNTLSPPTMNAAAPVQQTEQAPQGHVRDDSQQHTQNDEQLLDVIDQLRDVNITLNRTLPLGFEAIVNASKTSPMFVGKPAAEKEVLNILAMGITGVGKSTWINAIGNYITFMSMSEALIAEDLICVIPSKFSVKDAKRKNQDIVIGNCKNEVFKDGESSTQEPVIYQFETPKYIVNIIDTPGVGDTRGRQQDDENVEKILKVIAPIKKLHAVCVLLKSGEKRMTDDYVYCINKLLQQLHRDAAKNFAFFFTHNSSDSGDAEKLLGKFLSDLKLQHGIEIEANEKNKFFVENEGFRYVCAFHHGIELSNAKRATCAETWADSAEETNRFLDYAAALEPHDVENTLSINHTREMLSKLAEPLAEINMLAEDNIKVFQDRKKDLQATEETIIELMKHMYIPQITIVTEPLDSPRTVCLNCMEYQHIANTDQYQKFYKQVCCHDCNSIFDTLFWCDAFKLSGKCRKCKCDISQHTRIRFNQRKIKQMVEDVVVLQAIEEEEDLLFVKQMMVEECDEMIKELREEQKTIIAASAQFSLFLKHNAIVPPADDLFEKYFEKSIEEEEKCLEYMEAKNGRVDRTKLNNLKCLLTEYRKERNVMTTQSTVEDIAKTKSILFGLTHNGAKLQELFFRTVDGFRSDEDDIGIQKFEPSKYKYSIKATVMNAASGVSNMIGGFFGYGAKKQ